MPPLYFTFCLNYEERPLTQGALGSGYIVQ